MTLEEIIRIADAAYDCDQLVLAYHKEPEEKHGDGLAEFICGEITDVYDEDDTAVNQLAEAARVMQNAVDQLLAVASAFNDRLVHECNTPETCGVCHTCQKSSMNCGCKK